MVFSRFSYLFADLKEDQALDSKDREFVNTRAELKIMAGNDTACLTAKAELEKQAIQANQIQDANLMTGSMTGSGTDDVKEQSPRELHGWKVRRHTIAISGDISTADIGPVGDGIRFHVVHNISLCA